MSDKKDQPSTNLLFSPANNLFNVGNSNAFLVPVQGTPSSALMSSDPAEEDNFLGQNNSQQPATFSLFSGDTQNSDPFSAVGVPGSAPTTMGVSQNQPRLFVPPNPATLANSPYDTVYSPPMGGGQAYQSVGFATPPMMSPQSVASSSMPPPPPTLSYMNAAATSRSSPYANSRYVAPDYGTPQASMPPQTFNPNHMPPPISGYNHHHAPPPSQGTIGSGPPPSFTNLANSVVPPPTAESLYQSVTSHWCYSKESTDGGAIVWYPFSYYDAQRLEESFINGGQAIVATEGGRYDVSVETRERTSVYWEEPITQVRRCSWFAKGDSDYRYSPLDEELAQNLEREYKNVVVNNAWHKQIDLGRGEMIVIHNPHVIVQLIPIEGHENAVNLPEAQMKSRVIKRGINETELGKEIPENEIGAPDHIVFVCHGIGPVCDLRSRSIVECVDDFRAIQLSLLKSHFKNALEGKKAHRIEFLPVHWHRALHGDATGVDRDIRRLTLPSIQRLRHFTNETLLDILFYSSPVYCQTIAETVGSEVNSLHQLFLTRTPDFKGRVSLAGHSLGSLMLFDLLCNQGGETSQSLDTLAVTPVPQELSTSPSSSPMRSATPSSTHEDSKPDDVEVQITLDQLLAKLNLVNFKDKFEAEQMDMDTLLLCCESDLKDLGLPMGPRKKLIGYLKEQQLELDRKREQKEADEKRKREEALFKEQAAAAEVTLATSQGPPRLESLTSFMSSAMNVHVDFQQYDSGTGQPMVKYPQLTFNPLICFALGSPIGMFLTVRGISDLGEEFCLPTCDKFINIFHPYDPVAYRIEPLINPELSLKPVQVPHYKGRKRLHLELRDSLGRMGTELKQGIINSVRKAIGSMQKFAHNWQSGESSDNDVEKEVEKVADELLKEQKEKAQDNDDTVSLASENTQVDVGLGKINQGQRIDYVLQERPLESFNDYLFAFQSHFCYWNSEDTVLLMMKEIYKSMEIYSDSHIQKQQMLEQKPTLPPPPMQHYAPPPPTNSMS